MSCTEFVSSLGDIPLIILRSLLDFCSKRKYNEHVSFLLRCYIAALFDIGEYVTILLRGSVESSGINYVFYGICSVYGLFLIVISICICLRMEIHNCCSHLLFKCISLTMAVMIYGTLNDFKYLSVLNRVSEASSNLSISNIITLISLYDMTFITLGFFLILLCICTSGTDGISLCIFSLLFYDSDCDSDPDS